MASGDTLLIFGPLNASYPDTNHGFLGMRNGHMVLIFEDEATQSAYFNCVMPQVFGNGGVTVYIYFAHVAVTGDIDWEVAFERIGTGVQDIDVDGFAANNVATTNVPATSGLIALTTIAFTPGADMDNVDAGDVFRMRLSRNLADTAVGDVQVIAVEIRET